MALILSLIILGFLIFFFFDQKNQKIEAIKKSKVVAINSIKNNSNSPLLGKYCIPVRIITSDRIEFISLSLNDMGDVVYISFWCVLSEISIPKLKDCHNSIEFNVAKELSVYVKEITKIEQEIYFLQEQQCQVNDLVRLISKSEIYSSQTEIYNRASIEIENLIYKAKQLKELYRKVIREGLIGMKIASYNPSNIRNNHLAYYSQYEELRQEYDYLKDTTKAYEELMRQYHQ